MYARRMWEAMNRKKYQAGPAPTATAADAWASADAAQNKRQKAAEEAAHNSRRILEEEQARDQAWRQAVLQVWTAILCSKGRKSSCMGSKPSARPFCMKIIITFWS